MALQGKTIVTTRGAEQSRELRAHLEGLGARVIECPLIEIVPLEDWSAVDAAIKKLDSYHWLLFTSTNAVDQFMARMSHAQKSCNIPIAAVGSATDSRLQRWNLKAQMIPQDFRAEGLLESFPQDLTGVRILFPRAEVARELLPKELRRRGAQVDLLTVYQTVRSNATASSIRSIFSSTRIDCIVFTSSSTVRHLAEALGSDLKDTIGDTAIAVMGPITRETAIGFGLRPTIEAARSTIPDLVQSIDEALGSAPSV